MQIIAFLGFFPLSSVVLLHRFFKNIFMFRMCRDVLLSQKLTSFAQFTSGSPVSSQRWPRLTSLVSVSHYGWPCYWIESQCWGCPDGSFVLHPCPCQKMACSIRILRNSVNEYTCWLVHLILLFADCKIIFGITLGWCDSLASWVSLSYYPKDIQRLREDPFS